MKQFSFMMAAVLVMGACANAATNYVWQDSPNPTPPYSSWETAAHVIQDAVDAADPGDTVLVTNGVYASGGKAVPSFWGTNVVAADKVMDVVSVNGPATTIVDGLNPSASFARCVYLTNGAVLSGFTVTNGYRGVLCESTNAVVTNCVITGNVVGGGVVGGTLNNCLLRGNRSLGDAGGAADSILNNCTLDDNHGVTGGGASRSTLNYCTVVGNLAGRGGGVYECILNNCIVSSNGAGFYGGGAEISKLTNCTLIGNSARSGGGAYRGTLTNCKLIGNVGESTGGAAGSRLENCLVLGNSARHLVGGASGTLINCTVVGNSAGLRYGGVASDLVMNCVVYYNSAPGQPNFRTANTLNYTCTYPMPTNGVGNITNAPLFVDTNNWSDLHLRPDSPCIDAGNNDYVTTLTDLGGNPRIINGVVDMGAFEFQPLTPAELVLHLAEMVVNSDLSHKGPLLASLEAALASIERGSDYSAMGQLVAFQNKVGAQILKGDPVFAVELIEGAQQVMDALHNLP